MSDLYTLTPSGIVMYATEYCGDCKRARAFFEENQIAYLKVGLEGNEKAVNFVKTINKGNRSVPTIIFPDGSILVEPSQEELRIKFFT
jgi:mycoredoxin